MNNIHGDRVSTYLLLGEEEISLRLLLEFWRLYMVGMQGGDGNEENMIIIK